MRLVAEILSLAVAVFLITLLVRLVFSWVQVFARDWRPRGVVLVLAEAVYTVTDPPLRAVRSVVRPLTLGTVRVDLAFLVLLLGCNVLLWVLALVPF